MSSKSNFEYKKSEITWLPVIPAHWNTLKGKYLFTKMNRPILTTDEVVTCFRDGTVTLRKNRRLRGFTESIKEIGYQGIRKGDLVIHVMDAFAGAIGVSDSDGKATPVYSVCKPKWDLNPFFYALTVREMARSGYITSLAKGIRERSTDFRFETFAAQLLPHPPIEEQNAIAYFIDWNTKQINKFIQKKKRLIELLKEQKQAIINQAVTRGLDPNVRLKPSGVEWLGDIPEYWEIQRLRFIGAKFGSGVTPKGGASVYSKNGIPFLRSQNIHFDGLMLQDVVYINENIHQFMLNTHVKPNDVLLNITGASIGRVCCVPAEFIAGNVNQHVCIIRPKLNIINPEYLAKYLSCSSIQKEIVIGQNGASREGLTLKTIKSIPIVLPPLNEQLEIVHYCSNELEKINTLIKKLTQQIELVQEYRTRLISDVVTGQIDVRSIVIGDIPENELMEEALEEEQEEESLELVGAGDDD